MITNKTLPKNISYVDISKMSRKEWEKFRASQNTLGGSDVGTCVGLNRWKSNVELFYEKLKLYKREFHDSVPMLMGRELEAEIRRLFQYYDVDEPESFVDNYNAGLKVNSVRQRKATFINSKYPEFHANIDGLVKLKGRKKWGVCEIKYQSGQATRLWESSINPSYLAQLITYVQLMECEYGVLIIIEDANRWNVHVIERNETFFNHIYPTIQSFHQNLLTASVMIEDLDEAEQFAVAAAYEPEPYKEQSEPYQSFLSDYAKQKEAELVIEGDDEIWDMCESVSHLMTRVKDVENELQHAKNLVRKYMIDNGAQVITFGARGNVSYRTSLRFNIKLQKE